MTKQLWKLHSWLGLIAGLGLIVIGLSGSLLVFRDEIDGLVDARIMRVEPTPEGRLSKDRLYQSAQAAWPGYRIVGIGSRRDPGLAELVYLKKPGSHEYLGATLNPFTGAALSGPMTERQTFTGLLLELHYTWFADHVGMLITGILAVVLCLLGLSGIWLYRGFWKNFFRLRWRSSARIFFSDLHKMVGISSVAFNLVLGFTGAYWNLTHVAADGLGHHEEDPEAGASVAIGPAISFDALEAAAAERMPGFKATWFFLPDAEEKEISLWGTVPGSWWLSSPSGSSALFDPQSGSVVSVSDIRLAGTWQKITDAFTPVHFGNFGGVPVKILWSLLALAPGILAVSGFMIWFRRRKPLRKA
ncbi:PepSY-associated TM helix domain-containing protein [Luteolibacter luteus]|uniref:PepSY domain-containing protein n=1 Tax=Luteolibacter luteus TaxID=2728835 RepID=A0A858RJD9_9BACT|nr:PepSY-associated TM helix domain-containing protein [Luteolibacter luteus]QJE96598.1 PepSY domain-containing protein [Luteolibacter luteus]